MAETIAVIGLAASIAQLVDIGFKVVTRLPEVRHRATVTLQQHFIHVENQLPLLLHVLKAVAADAKTEKLSLQAQENLKRAIDGYDLAESLYTRALTGQEQQLGPAHPFTLKTVRDVAQLRFYQGFGAPTHPNILRAASGLANVLQQQGKTDQARQLFETTLSSQQARLRPDHPDTLRPLRDYDRLQHRLGNVVEGHRMLTEAYARLEKALGPKHPDVRECAYRWTASRTTGDSAGNG